MFCRNCGNEIVDSASFCGNCGACISDSNSNMNNNQSKLLLTQLSERLNTNAIIWLVIGVLQILGGIFIDCFLLIVGVLNIISSVQDMNYSKTLSQNSTGIVAKFEPLTVPIITLVYNLVIGGVIGVIGSIYYFFAIRNFVLENKEAFESLDT